MEAKQEEEDTTCAICMENQPPTQSSCILPCRHRFHMNCIRTLLRHTQGTVRCPLCRAPSDLEGAPESVSWESPVRRRRRRRDRTRSLRRQEHRQLLQQLIDNGELIIEFQ